MYISFGVVGKKSNTDIPQDHQQRMLFFCFSCFFPLRLPSHSGPTGTSYTFAEIRYVISTTDIHSDSFLKPCTSRHVHTNSMNITWTFAFSIIYERFHWSYISGELPCRPMGRRLRTASHWEKKTVNEDRKRSAKRNNDVYMHIFIHKNCCRGPFNGSITK